MNPEHEKLAQEILHQINEVTAPGRMTAQEALEYLEYLSSCVEAAIDGLQDDIKNADDK